MMAVVCLVGVIKVQYIKKQVYLTPAQDLAVRQLAEAEKISDSQVVRRALEVFFRQTRETSEAEEAFTALIGAGKAKQGHSSETVDRDLYLGNRF